MDDGRNQSGFSAPCSCTQGFTKRASVPLATTESRWWESGALGGRNRAMAGEKEREKERVDERDGRGVEVERESKSRQTPALWRKTKCRRGVCVSLILLYLSHLGGLIHDTQETGWDGDREADLKREGQRMEDKKNLVKEKRSGKVKKSTKRRQQSMERNSVKEESNLSGRGSKWQMLLLWPCSSRL